MRFQRSDIFQPKTKISSIQRQNSSICSPYESRYVKVPQQNDSFRILSYKPEKEEQKQKVYRRCNLTIQYIPEFVLVSQSTQTITIKIKQYTLELLPWLIKKDSLFKVNIVLGIYIAFLELVDIYGLFPIHPNMMKVNQKQQVAVWINKNFQALKPDQVLTRNAFSMREFMKSFLRIFKCCLPNKRMSEMYAEPNQLLNQLAKLKRKQQMHKNCHQFIKHDSKLQNSRRSNKYQSTLMIQSQKQLSLMQRYSTKPIIRASSNIQKDKGRFSSFSPPKRTQRQANSRQKFNQTAGFKSKNSIGIGGEFLKKKFAQSQITHYHQRQTSIDKQPSIHTTGDYFKRYLLYNTSKYHKMSKVNTQPPQCESSRKLSSKKGFIFRSEVYKENQIGFSQTIIEERNSVQVMSQQLMGVEDQKKVSFIKLRKMSSNTSERKIQEEEPKRFMNSAGWKKSTFKEHDSFLFGQEQQENAKNQTKQRLKSSFPYKTASTLNSFRLSNQHQYHHIFPSKSQENLNCCSMQSLPPLNQKQKDKKIEQMKIVEQNQLQNDFNNIFSMQNSNIRKEEEEKMEKIITEFQQVLF